MAWYNDRKRHSDAAKGKKTGRSNIRKTDWDYFQKECREDAYQDKVDNISDELNEDKVIPYIKEDNLLAVRSEDGVHVFDTTNKRVFEANFFDSDRTEFEHYGPGLKVSKHPVKTTHEYLKDNEYNQRYRKYAEVWDRIDERG